jgi:hypothetical protein
VFANINFTSCSEYPQATTGGNYLRTRPAFDLEHLNEQPSSKDVADVRNVHLPTQNDDEWDQ